MNQSPFVAAAVAAARAAEPIIQGYFRSDLEVARKADRSPVTRADLEAEAAIRQVLSEAFPAHGYFGEELGRERAEAEYVWLIDPIDGTKSFVRGQPFFSTQIALHHRGRTLLGVSNAPQFQELAWAERGCGAWLNDGRLQVADCRELSRAVLSCGNLHSLAGYHSAWTRLGGLVRAVDRFRGYGDFYHYHLLASGRIDAVIESDVNVLDVAALSVIVEEAGGCFTQLDGRPIDLHSRDVLAACRPELHRELQRRLRE